jgi:hypothetical protein
VPRRWQIPEGLRVRPDGSWRVGELPVAHERSLRFFKTHLVLEDGGAFIVDRDRRIPVVLEGPPLEATALVFDDSRGELRARFDDGTEEPVGTALHMNEQTGRFECAARGGRTRAVLSRAAHEALLERVEQEGGSFFVRVGGSRVAVRT